MNREDIIRMAEECGIPEFENKALRVILLEDGMTVHNAFFDRDFTEEQA